MTARQVKVCRVDDLAAALGIPLNDLRQIVDDLPVDDKMFAFYVIDGGLRGSGMAESQMVVITG